MCFFIIKLNDKYIFNVLFSSTLFFLFLLSQFGELLLFKMKSIIITL